MKYSAEMGLGAMMYIPRLIKIYSAIQKLRENTQTRRQHGDRISLLLFFKQNQATKKGL
jgi:hypothetical protein